MILKFVGVYPSGLNRIHDTIQKLNDMILFANTRSGRVELLSSKYAHEHGSYVVEIRVPFRTHNEEYGSERKVPQFVMWDLFGAVNEFQP